MCIVVVLYTLPSTHMHMHTHIYFLHTHTRQGKYYKTNEYMEIDVDIHIFCFAARKAVFNLKSRIKELIMDLGMVVEGRGKDVYVYVNVCIDSISFSLPSS